MTLALATLPTSSAGAQGVTRRGKLEDARGTQSRSVVDGTNTDLASSALNLNLFVGHQVEGTGDGKGSVASPLMEVQAAAGPAPQGSQEKLYMGSHRWAIRV
jgi:hypothetical protein